PTQSMPISWPSSKHKRRHSIFRRPPEIYLVHQELHQLKTPCHTIEMERNRIRRRRHMTVRDAKALRVAPLKTPTDLKSNAIQEVSGALNVLLADMLALYLKTKNFHWHVSGPHFRDYHLLLDEHADQIFATTDAIAERVRKIGGTTVR